MRRPRPAPVSRAPRPVPGILGIQLISGTTSSRVSGGAAAPDSKSSMSRSGENFRRLTMEQAIGKVVEIPRAILETGYCRQALLLTSDGDRVELGTRECTGTLAQGLAFVNGMNSSRQAIGITHAFDEGGRYLADHAAFWDGGWLCPKGRPLPRLPV